MKRLLVFTFTCLIAFTCMTLVANTFTPSFMHPTQAAPDPNKNLTVDSNSMGLRGPFSISAQYSSLSGYLVTGRYLQLLNKRNAINLEADYGEGEARLNGTWAYRLSAHQLVKFTLERLWQRLKFDFDSGREKKWVGQTAFGADYRYALTKNPYIKSIDVGAYYAKAQSENLSDKYFWINHDEFINYRHIAGATSKGVSAGVSLSLWPNSLVTAALNYDYIHYPLKYHTESVVRETTAGLGGTFTLKQLFAKKLLLGLTISPREVYDQYGVDVQYLLPSAPGTSWLLGLQGQYTKSTNNQPNDRRFGVDMSFAWGDKSGNNALTLSMPQPDNLLSFVSKAAVHMNSVLAVVDQSKKQITFHHGALTVNATPSNAIPVLNIAYPQPLANRTVEVGQHIVNTFKAEGVGPAQTPTTGGGLFVNDEATLNGSVTVEDSSGSPVPTVSGHFTAAIPGTPASYLVLGQFASIGTYTTTFNAANGSGAANPASILRYIVVPAADPPTIGAVSDKTITEGTAMNDFVTTNITNPDNSGEMTAQNITVTLSNGDPLPTGITYQYVASATKPTQEGVLHMSYNGGELDNTSYVVKITARNTDNKEAVATFNITVTPGSDEPKITPDPIPIQTVNIGKPQGFASITIENTNGGSLTGVGVKLINGDPVPSAFQHTWTLTTIHKGVFDIQYDGTDPGAGNYTFRVSATDAGHQGKTVERDFGVVVANETLAPHINPVAIQEVRVGTAQTPLVETDITNNSPNSGSIDTSKVDVTQSDGSPLPTGFSYAYTSTGTKSGTMAINYSGANPGGTTYTFKINAANTVPLASSTEFQVHVTQQLSPPTIEHIGSQTVTYGTASDPVFSAEVTNDPDSGEIDDVTVTQTNGSALPTGFDFSYDDEEAEQGFISVTYDGGDPGAANFNFRVNAANTEGLSSHQDFAMTVNNYPTPQPPGISHIADKSVTVATAQAPMATAEITNSSSSGTLSSVNVTQTSGSALPTGFSFSHTVTDANNWALSIGYNGANPGASSYNFRVTAENSHNLSSAQDFAVTVVTPAQAPVVAPVSDQTVTVGSRAEPLASTTIINGGGVSGDLRSVEVKQSNGSALPTGFSFNHTATNPNNWTLTVNYDGSDPGAASYVFLILASNTQNLVGQSSFNVTVNQPAAQAPVVDAISNKTLTVGTAASSFATTTVTNPAHSGTLNTVNVAQSNGDPLPAGITFDPGTGDTTRTVTVSYNGDASTATGQYTLRVSATNTESKTGSTDFGLTINAQPQTPTIATIGDQTVTVGTQSVPMASAQVTNTAANSGDLSSVIVTQQSGSPLPAGFSYAHTETDAKDWTLNVNYDGSDPGAASYVFRVTATNTKALSSQADFNVTVNPLPATAPAIGAIGAKTVTIGTHSDPMATTAITNTEPNSGDLQSVDVTLSDGSALPTGFSYSHTATDTKHWTLNIAYDGSDPGSSPYTFQVKAENTKGLTSFVDFTVTVTAAPQAPVIAAIADKTVTVGVAAEPMATTQITNTTPNSGELTSATVALSNGNPLPTGFGFNHVATDTKNWALNVNYDGENPGASSYTLRVTAENSESISSHVDFGVTVNPAPLPPTIAPIGDQSVTVGTTAQPMVSAAISNTAPNSGDLSSVDVKQSDGSNLPTGFSFAHTVTDSKHWNLTVDYDGKDPGASSYTFKVTAENSASLSSEESFDVTVNPAAQAPAINAITDKTVTVGTEANPFATTTVTNTAPNSGTIRSIDVTQSDDSNLPAGFTFTATTGDTSRDVSINYNGDDPGGTAYTLRVSATNTKSLSSHVDFGVTVNAQPQAPTIGAIDDQTVTVGVKSEPLVATAITNTALNSGTIESVTVAQSDGTALPTGFSFTHTESDSQNSRVVVNYDGTDPGASAYTFRVTATNSAKLSSHVDFAVTVNPALQPPTIAPIEDQTVTVDTANKPLFSTDISNTAPASGDMKSVNVTQSDGNPLPTAFTFSHTATDAKHWVLSMNYDGTAPGASAYTFRVTAENDKNLSSTLDFAMTVNPAPQKPTIATIADQTVWIKTPAQPLAISTITANTGNMESVTVQQQNSKPLPTGFSFDLDKTSASEWTVSINYDGSDPKTKKIKASVVASNSAGLTADQDFNITVIDQPVVEATLTCPDASTLPADQTTFSGINVNPNPNPYSETYSFAGDSPSQVGTHYTPYLYSAELSPSGHSLTCRYINRFNTYPQRADVEISVTNTLNITDQSTFVSGGTGVKMCGDYHDPSKLHDCDIHIFEHP